MQGLYLAMYGDKVEIGQALFISIFAMAVVFFVLLIISYLIDATAFLIKGSIKAKKVDAPKVVAPKEQKVETKNDNTVAIIAASIAAYLGTSVDNIKIAKIRRVSQSDTAWTERGLLSQINK